MKKILGMFTGPFGLIYNFIKKNSVSLAFLPVKPDIENGKIEIDNSAGAIFQMAMILLLSDIDCEVIWPTNIGSGIVGKTIIKSLDLICPSIMDLLAVCTFGGTSIGARIAKVSKYASKAGRKALKVAAKAGSKVAQKELEKTATKTGLKATMKSRRILSTIPKPIRKFLMSNKNKLKKINKTSRSLKKTIMAINTSKQTYEAIKNEIIEMSTDDLFVFSKNAISNLVHDYLPEDKKNKVDDVMSTIPDGVIDKVSEYAKNKVKEKRGEEVENEVTMNDVIIEAIPENLKNKIYKFSNKIA